MTAWDVGTIMTGIGVMAALVDCVTGLQIAKALRKVLRGKTPHLRGRKPAEGGVGAICETQLQEVVRVERFSNRRGSGDDLSGWDDVVRETMRRERAALMVNRLPEVREQAGLANARAFHAWLDERGVEPPTAFEYEALREDWQRKQAAEVSPLDRARLAAWGAALRGEASIALPLDQYRAALEHHFAQRVWRDPGELPHLYGVRLAVKAV